MVDISIAMLNYQRVSFFENAMISVSFSYPTWNHSKYLDLDVLNNSNYSNRKGEFPEIGVPPIMQNWTILVLKPMVTWGTTILGNACHQTCKVAGKFQSERRFIARKNI